MFISLYSCYHWNSQGIFLPYTVRKCQSERENHSENRAQHRDGRKGEIQLNHEKYEEHICEKYTTQKPEHALQNVILERAIRAKKLHLFINPSIFYGRNYSAPEMLNPFSASTEIWLHITV